MNVSISRPVARTTGLLYLAMAFVGVPGFLVIRPVLFDHDSPAATMAQLVENEALARVGIGLELALVIVQALTALWFFRLFRTVDRFAAGALAAFGTVNAIAILVSAAGLATALEAALGGDAAGTQLMYALSGSLWGVGAVFFGLWLVPMGLLARPAGMPRALGWILVAGGIGYVASAFVGYVVPDAGPLAQLLTAPATVGEFWMIGLLLWHGLRRTPAPATEATHQEAPAEA
ncbi:DUF4386 domain-containing protein [Isoptericola croceus]|uniref:DUF4386 domain-containing protein n=1 Tax=Isoptericola croceus TaxID=3031406 RepID=UPI0023F9746B|nr:DUF4386 domain-containing protein [Isoptericola croceus]